MPSTGGRPAHPHHDVALGRAHQSEGYNQSKMAVDIDKCLEAGTRKTPP